MRPIQITDPADPKIKDFQGLRKTSASTFVVDGYRTVINVMSKGTKVRSILATGEVYVLHPEWLTMAEFSYSASKTVMEQLLGYDLHKGVMAQFHMPLSTELKEFSGSPVIALDGVNKAENVGAIIRTMVGCGIRHLLLGPDCLHPFHRRSVRVSMGQVLEINYHFSNSLAEALRELKSQGHALWALDKRPGSIELSPEIFSKWGPVCLIIGAEDKGVRPENIELCEGVTEIPVTPEVGYFNASVAAAMACYEWSKVLRK